MRSPAANRLMSREFRAPPVASCAPECRVPQRSGRRKVHRERATRPAPSPRCSPRAVLSLLRFGGALTGDLQGAGDCPAEAAAKVNLDVVRGRILANVDDHLSGDIGQSRDRPVSWRKGWKEVHEDACI